MLGLIRPMVRFAAPFLALSGISLAGSVSVSKVDFRLVEQPGGSDRWYEIAIVLEVQRAEQTQATRNRRFVDGVSVALALAIETEVAGARHYDFYEANTTLVTLELGRHEVRFYLPPELVKRDRIRGEPHSFEVGVTSAQTEEASLLFSRNLQTAEALASFRARLAESVSATDGILLPQHDTPFGASYPDATPSPRRASGRD